MATPLNSADIQPRQVANKSTKKALLDAIRMTLDVQSAAVRLNTQTFNRNRYAATALIGDYNELTARARLKRMRSRTFPNFCGGWKQACKPMVDISTWRRPRPTPTSTFGTCWYGTRSSG